MMMNLFCLTTTILVSISSITDSISNTNQDLLKYAACYEFILTDTLAYSKLKTVFQDLTELENGISRELFCIDSIAHPLLIYGFHDYIEKEKRSEITDIRIGSIPFIIESLSYCGNQAELNLLFSVASNSYVTVELSSVILNPIGGCDKGPVLKWLFKFNEENEITEVVSQTYMNG